MNIHERAELLRMIRNCYEPQSLVGAAIDHLADAIRAPAFAGSKDDPVKVTAQVREHNIKCATDFLLRAEEDDWKDKS
jgi:hypothetical protein